MPPRRTATKAETTTKTKATKATAAAAKSAKPAKTTAATKKTTATKKAAAATPAPKKAPAKAATKKTAASAKTAKNATNAKNATGKRLTTTTKKTSPVDTDENKENTAPKTNGVTKRKRAAKEEEEEEKEEEKKEEKKEDKKAVSKKTTKVEKEAPKNNKRKADDDETEEEEEEDKEEEERPSKAARKAEDDTAPTAASKAAKTSSRAVTPAPVVVKKPAYKIGKLINEAPSKPLDIFVFGEGTSGELGLGSVKVDNKKPTDVKRPRLNPKLAAGTVGVVQIAVGGMHAAALTKDNKILTWGVNDQGALGRDTTWEGGLRDADEGEDSDSDSDDDDDSGVNPRESNPAEIDMTDVVPGTQFVQVTASDSATFALTADGRVYGWGTFRASDGVLGFSRTVLIQKTPVLLPEPRKIQQLATGSNHILALDEKGKLYTWGCPEQNQLGRRCVQRDIKASALRPGGVAFRRGVRIHKIACGSYHSFALDTKGRVYAWGLNNFGQLNVNQDGGDGGAGESDATVLDATYLDGLADYVIADIDGGEHHALACTDDGRLLTWGRIDGFQTGLPSDAFTQDNALFDDRGKPRILTKPTIVPLGESDDTSDKVAVSSVSAGTDNSFALTTDGQVYSWGFSANYQTGQGTTDDIETPTLIDNTAVRGRKLVYAGAGGQFSILASYAA